MLRRSHITPYILRIKSPRSISIMFWTCLKHVWGVEQRTCLIGHNQDKSRVHLTLPYPLAVQYSSRKGAKSLCKYLTQYWYITYILAIPCVYYSVIWYNSTHSIYYLLHTLFATSMNLVGKSFTFLCTVSIHMLAQFSVSGLVTSKTTTATSHFI